MRKWLWAGVLLWGCSQREPVGVQPLGKPMEGRAVLGLPAADLRGATVELVALGKKLYEAKELSADRTVACITCHNPQFGFTDGQRVATGIGGQKGKRNAPTVWNAVFHRVQFHDGRAKDLEEQARGPILNPMEMGATEQSVASCCGGMAEDFRKAYGSPEVTLERVTRAIAAYERTLVSGNSAFDRYFYGKDEGAVSDAVKRGLAVFRDPERGNCAACHSVGKEFALFTDGQFHNLGVGMDAEGKLQDLGRYVQTRRDGDQGAFRTPTLRNIARTGPYMHDGSLKTLKEVVDFYVAGGNSNDWRDPLLKPLPQLTREDKANLIAFLESLNGEEVR